jgi:hypothetical protein
MRERMWELVPTNKLFAPVILPLLAFQADCDFPKIIQRMASVARGIPVVVPTPSNGDVVTRLLPNFC